MRYPTLKFYHKFIPLGLEQKESRRMSLWVALLKEDRKTFSNCSICGQSYNVSMIVNYDYRGVPDQKLPIFHDSRLTNYSRKLFIRWPLFLIHSRGRQSSFMDPGNTHRRGSIPNCMADLLFDWFVFDQTSKTVVQQVGQPYSDTSPLVSVL